MIYGGGNVIENCYIGVNAAGDQDAGNKQDGILVYSSNNRIGGAVASKRNVISGNDRTGIEFASNANNNQVQGNFIGVDVGDVNNLGNGAHGITIRAASNNATWGNVIRFNLGAGVFVDDSLGATTGNAILANSIFSNSVPGIDLSPSVTRGVRPGRRNQRVVNAKRSGHTRPGLFAIFSLRADTPRES